MGLSPIAFVFGLRRARDDSSSNNSSSLSSGSRFLTDSWPDLESTRGHNDTPPLDPGTELIDFADVVRSPSQAWHPSRESRLVWSFSPTRIDRTAPQHLNRSECSRDSGVILERSEDQGVARMPTRDPAVLVPRIVVTPAVRAIEGDRGAMWIAVEVSAELCQPTDGTFLPMTPVSNNGFPVPGTEPRQLGDCSMLFPGLKVLVLAHVHFEAKGPIPFRPNGHIRQRSDDLIDDLEDQLGSSRVEYLRIVVKYKHSAFPKCGRSDTVDGVADVETKLETSATAALQHLNHRSLWSPRESSLGKDGTVRQPEAARIGWSELRQPSVAGWRRSRAEDGQRVPSNATCPEDSASDDRDVRSPGILRSPRSMGAGLLRTLGASDDVTADGQAAESRSLRGSFRGQRGKQTSRWGWTSWW
ncbi:hypothetical protein CCHR01_00134 [Colletotrichum chrysophilum]|uniref:Uncharacterized protein n=1 Tax=Colletotrichum chrysophilum TaxID=1836956 RepID=A0AAD9B072_9PEZI|nr:hypothetical protein CCHR01_00134 [Colletotrichum chrysophilum]